jgi:ketosteroid isomerase-like protein
MTVTRADVQAWLDRYVAAWTSYDPDAIRALFAEDAEYRYHPWDEPTRGREAILRGWLEPSGAASTRDAPGTWEAHYEPYAVEGQRAVTIGETVYRAEPGGTIDRRYANAWLLEFDDAGRCRSFTEYYVRHR